MENEKGFSNSIIEPQKEEDDEYSDFDYKDKDFELSKYEKFKPKNNDSDNNLKKTENQVKNLLSFYIKNIENENKNTDIFSDEKKTKINKKETRKKLAHINKTHVIKSVSLNANLNYNNKLKIPKEELSNNNKKIKSNLNIININNNYQSKDEKHIYKNKKRKSNNSNDRIQSVKNSKIKEKIKNFFKSSSKSFGSHAFKDSKEIGNNESNDLITKINKISNKNIANQKFLIKKQKSVNQNISYLNFKNDFIIKKSSKNNDDILKMFNKNKKSGLFNNSLHNSILSDFSDCNLNKKSSYQEMDYKDKESYIKDNINNTMNSYNQKSSNEKKLSKLLIKKDSNNLSKFSNKNTKIISPKQQNNFGLKISNEILDMSNHRQPKGSLKNKKEKLYRNSKFLQLNTNLKTLKEQLKNSLILRPEQLRLSFNIENNIPRVSKILENEEKNKHNKSFKKSISLIDNSKKLQTQKNSVKNKSNNNLDLLFAENNIKDINTQKSLKSNKSISNISSKHKFDVENHIKVNDISIEKYRILARRQCIYDSLDDEEFEDEEEINTLYLEPNSLFSIIFDFIIFSINIISLFEVPFYLAINHPFCKKKQITFIFLINFIIELLNIIDLFLGFFRAFYNWEEQLIHKNKIIAKNYITSWFLFDLIASVPFYTINRLYEPICKEREILSNNYNVVINNLNYIFINNRLFKIIKIFKDNQAWKIISNNLNDYGYNKLRIIIYIFLFYASINYAACLYIFIGRNSFPNWILETKLETEEFLNIYICAIYILIMAITTVGYGDITCYSFNERIFQILLLIIGIVAYSTVISFLSNYIKKNNEKSVDYEKRLSILDDIKRTHPNLPGQLYEKIVRYLKFKNIYEKKLKYIIFDCLPVGLKNNLILEMYKPIIKNFIFFKNFNNTDFIVRVILAFKPIMAYKNDILVNDGELVKDIIFVEKGILSVELPINMKDKQENIDKYLNETLLSIEEGPNYQQIGNNIIIQGNNPNLNNAINKTKNQKPRIKNSLTSFYNDKNLMKYTRSFNKNLPLNSKEKGENNYEKKKNISYIRIIGIRKNEHFGDVLMFLGQKSPLRVRVKSIKCELFFLKKIDAIKISSSYQNIWRRINKKSVYNFEQMKKTIRKMVEIYCSVKINKSIDKKLSNDIILNDNNIKDKYKNSKNNNNKILKIREEKRNIKKSKSLIIPQINYYNKLLKNVEINNDFHSKDNNPKKIKLYHSAKKLKRLFNLSPKIINNKKENPIKPLNSSSLILSSSIYSFHSSVPSSYLKRKKVRLKKVSNNKIIHNKEKENNKYKQQALNSYKENYQFHQVNNQNNELNAKITIEREKQNKENYLNPISNISSIQKFQIKRKRKINNSNKDKYIFKNSNKNNTKLKIDGEEIEESESSFDQIINKELYSGEEEIKLDNGDNLLDKKIDFHIVSTKNENYETIKSIIPKNRNLEKLLNSFEEKDINNLSISGIISNISKFESNKNFIFNFKNKENNYKSNKHILLTSNISNSKNEKKRLFWNNNILSINNNISFQFNSLYDNLYLIGGDKLIKNKLLQKNIKKYLKEQIQENVNRSNKNSLKKIKHINSFEESTNYNKDRKYSFNTLEPKKKSSKSIGYKKIKNINCILMKSNTSKLLDHLSIINEKQKNKKNKFQSGILNEDINKHLNSKIGKENYSKQKTVKFKNMNILNNINNNINYINYINNSNRDLIKKYKARRHSAIIEPISKVKKKKDNLLSTINFNIMETNQNLNNPDVFYSNYFNSILEGEIIGKKKSRNSIFFSPTIHEKLKKNHLKEKTPKKSLFINEY